MAKMTSWLDSLRADATLGWRRLAKKKVTSAAAILSLALAMGACTSAFQLVDALLLRPLPVAEPQRLYVLSRQESNLSGKVSISNVWGYADFRQLRAAAKGQADSIAISSAQRMDVTYRPDVGPEGEMEKANVQYVSGWMFGSFGLRPALGRLLTESDDLLPGAHPFVVLSYDYWTRRFARDPKVIGRTIVIGRRFGIGNDLFKIVGVAGERFTGTQPGTVTDVFAPTMMSALLIRPEASWLQTYVRLKPGVALEPVRDRLRAAFRVFSEAGAKGAQVLLAEPAAEGVSRMQADYRVPLAVLGVLVALVLLIACANVANLMTAQAAARAREMALRVSIGAERWRLVQLVLVESALLAVLAAVAGALFAWWSAPFVVARINPPDNPARLFLSADWRVGGFGLALTLCVTFLCGLGPALRASAVKLASALKGGEDPHSRRHLMHALIAMQAAFCFVVLFAGGLFAATFERLSHQTIGFAPERLLNIDAVAERAQPPVFWDQVAEHLRAMPGVETVTLADWPLLDGYGFKFNAISIDGGPPTQVSAAFMNVSPGWIDAMKIPFIHGRDFRPSDMSPGAAIVNDAFAKQFFNGENPIGKSFAGTSAYMRGQRFQIVGLVRDVPYRFMRQPILPVAYTPFHRTGAKGAIQNIVEGTFIVRTASQNPLALASILRKEVSAIWPGFRVSNIRTEEGLIDAQTVRERLLAILGLFFAVVAVLLASIGLYGVLEYSVVQRRREIGIRMALGAQAGDVARRVTANVFSMVLVGAVAGLAIGTVSVRYIEALLYGVKATEPGVLALPSLAILIAALLAALPAVIHAVRLDPATLLRAE
jgi:predicted permease